ncbi:MAG: histidine phosphatase family protein [Rhodothermales bacterium]
MNISRRIYLPLILTLFSAIAGVLVYQGAGTTTVILVRHAEKIDDSANPSLSPEGLMRAESLVQAVEAYEIDGMYSTNFCRTALTVQPLALALALPIHIQKISARGGFKACNPVLEVALKNLPAELNDEAAFKNYLLEKHAGETVLVVGHSNTTPSLVNALGAGAFDVPQLDHEAYDDVFVVTLNRDTVKLTSTTYTDLVK